MVNYPKYGDSDILKLFYMVASSKDQKSNLQFEDFF